MSSNIGKSQGSVRGGDRNIHFSSKNMKGSERNPLQDDPVMQMPLVNVETRTVSTGQSIKNELKKVAAFNGGSGFKGQGRKAFDKGIWGPTPLPESAEPIYGAPELHSTLRVGRSLANARKKNPDFVKLVGEKLNSPTTESRFKKGASKKVSVPVSKKIFSDLVSVDVSEEELAKQLEEQLTMRAAVVRPTPQAQDPEPQLSDYFNPEDYVTKTRITTAKLYLPFSCVKPQTVKREDYLKLYGHFLGSSYR